MSSSFQDPPGPDQQPGQPSAPPPPGYYAPPPGQGYQPPGQGYQPQGPGFQYAGGPPPSPAGGPPREALAGFWQRFGGAFIDGILLLIVGLVLSIPFGLTSGLDNLGSVESVQAIFAGNLISLLLGAVYFTYFHSTSAGQTIGNRAVGVRIMDAATGTPLPYARAFLRYLVSAAATIVSLVSPAVGSIVSLLVLIGYLWMIWDPRKQTWHDKAANSLVVKSAAYPPPGDFGRPARRS